jgi:hypothetical protein
MIPNTCFNLAQTMSHHASPTRVVQRTHPPLGFAFIRLGLAMTLACLLTSCAFQGQFDKGFINSRLMQLAANPDEIIPDFAWADHVCETANLVGGSLSGGGGCST